MILTLSTLLTLLPADVALPPPTQPACFWNLAGETLLWPAGDGRIIASDSYLWVHIDNFARDEHPTLDDSAGNTLDLESTTIVVPTGDLLQLRPMGGFKAGEHYTLRLGEGTFALEVT